MTHLGAVQTKQRSGRPGWHVHAEGLDMFAQRACVARDQRTFKAQ